MSSPDNDRKKWNAKKLELFSAEGCGKKKKRFSSRLIPRLDCPANFLCLFFLLCYYMLLLYDRKLELVSGYFNKPKTLFSSGSMWNTKGSSCHSGFLLFDTHLVLLTISADVGICIFKYGSGVSTEKAHKIEFWISRNRLTKEWWYNVLH